MTISLSDYETGARYDGDYAAALAALDERLERLQAAHIVHAQRSVIMVEGWDAAGKGGIIRRLTASLDPRYFEVWPIGAPTDEEKARHFLWRFVALVYRPPLKRGEKAQTLSKAFSRSTKRKRIETPAATAAAMIHSIRSSA